jgi:hypothetical protein
MKLRNKFIGMSACQVAGYLYNKGLKMQFAEMLALKYSAFSLMPKSL